MKIGDIIRMVQDSLEEAKKAAEADVEKVARAIARKQRRAPLKNLQSFREFNEKSLEEAEQTAAARLAEAELSLKYVLRRAHAGRGRQAEADEAEGNENPEHPLPERDEVRAFMEHYSRQALPAYDAADLVRQFSEETQAARDAVNRQFQAEMARLVQDLSKGKRKI